MLFGPGEILEGRPIGCLVHDPQIDLEPPGHDHRPLSIPRGQDIPHLGKAHESLDHGGPVPAGGEDVDVAHGLPHPAKAPGYVDSGQTRDALELRDDLFHDRERLAERESSPGPFEPIHPAGDILDLLFPEPGEARQAPVADQAFQVVEIFEAEPVVGELEGLRPEPLDAEQIERDLPDHFLVLAHSPGCEILVDLLRERLSHTRELAQAPLGGHDLDVLDQVGENPGRLSVGVDLKRIFAEELKAVGDLFEDFGENAVLHGIKRVAYLREAGKIPILRFGRTRRKRCLDFIPGNNQPHTGGSKSEQSPGLILNPP